jgi:hypothetical protein
VPVAPDFWQQFRLAEELAVIHETRPSAFHARPAGEPHAVADVGARA